MRGADWLMVGGASALLLFCGCCSNVYTVTETANVDSLVEIGDTGYWGSDFAFGIYQAPDSIKHITEKGDTVVVTRLSRDTIYVRVSSPAPPPVLVSIPRTVTTTSEIPSDILVGIIVMVTLVVLAGVAYGIKLYVNARSNKDILSG